MGDFSSNDDVVVSCCLMSSFITMLVIKDGDELIERACSVSYIVTRRLFFVLLVGRRSMLGVAGVVGDIGSWQGGNFDFFISLTRFI